MLYLSNISGDIPVSCLNLVGSHDSATAFVSFSKWAKCQTLNIEKQLEAGVRFFDLRLYAVNNTIRLVHGSADCYCDETKKTFLTFDMVLDTLTRFLHENPRETVIVSIKKDRGFMGIFAERFFSLFYKKYISENNIWFKENRVPTLEEARGKIILFRRCRTRIKDDCGLDFSVWKNQKSEKDTEPFKVKVSDNVSAYVQDSYNVEPYKKWKICKKFSENAKPDKNTIAVNFFSTASNSAPCKNASVINKLFNDFKIKTDKCSGWYILDFVDKNICEKIMETNTAIHSNQ